MKIGLLRFLVCFQNVSLLDLPSFRRIPNQIRVSRRNPAFLVVFRYVPIYMTIKEALR